MVARFSVLSVCLVVISCQSSRNDKDSSGKPQSSSSAAKGNCQTDRVFNNQDSTGIFRGVVIDAADTSQSMSQGLLQLAASNGDTVIFSFDYDQVSISVKRLSPGTCAEVSYYAEIQRVEVDSSDDGKRGDEISRHFYISEINYID